MCRISLLKLVFGPRGGTDHHSQFKRGKSNNLAQIKGCEFFIQVMEHQVDHILLSFKRRMAKLKILGNSLFAFLRSLLSPLDLL